MNPENRGLRHPRRRARAARALTATLAFAAGVLALAGTATSADPGRALLLRLDDTVNPATADYLVRGIQTASERGAALVIVQMDTPGGLDTSMREIIRAILASDVPVASYVTPSGARAASAGTYIMYASHIAAMAPGTNLGAATPISIGGGLPLGGQPEPESAPQGSVPDQDQAAGATAPRNAEEAKAINDAIAYIRGLAELRGRNIEWAEAAVREAASLTSSAALEANVIDFVAGDLDELLAKADGRTVQVGQTTVTLHTEGLSLEALEPDWRTELLAVITNPNVAVILMLIGIYGLIFEFLNPGSTLPGTVGAISLVMGLYALAVLPVSYAGVALLVLGALLVLAEALVPSFGALGIGGAISLVLGATILIEPGTPGLSVSWPVVAGLAVASVGLSGLIARLAVLAHRHRVVIGAEQMLGGRAEVVSWNGIHGYVLVGGERWKAVADRPIEVGHSVEITAIDGLTLTVAARDAPAATGPAQETPD